MDHQGSNSNPSEDTIIAPASALGGGVAVIRASGPMAGKIFRLMVRKPLLAPRVAQLVTLLHPQTEKILDRAVALYFQNPGSYTGEDVLEFHVHGGSAVVRSVLQAMLAVDPSIRLAEGGEFTKRAYLLGKIDLTEAEAIADLVAAETEAQAELALGQMRGELRDLYEEWRVKLSRLLAHIEAAIDFVDEEDVPPSLLAEAQQTIGILTREMTEHLGDGNLGKRLRDGFVVAVVGAPNAGKSSLVNMLAKRDVAIVTPVAGTTRDILEVPLNLGGFPVIVMDTAGLRETVDVIEFEGIRRARLRAKEADIVLALYDATTVQNTHTLAITGEHVIPVMTKSDLMPPLSSIREDGQAISISTQTGDGINRLIERIVQYITGKTRKRNDSIPLLTRDRHRKAVTEAVEHLQRGIGNPIPELFAEDIRLAMRALGRITGRVDVEDVLDIIFKDFCIGK